MYGDDVFTWCAVAVIGIKTERKNKTKKYLPWQFGIEYDKIGRESAQDLFDEQLEAREMLRGNNDVEGVVVSTGMFMSFLLSHRFV